MSNTILCEHVKKLCEIYNNVDLWTFLLDEKYSDQTKSKIKNVTIPNNDGLIGSIRIPFKSFSVSVFYYYYYYYILFFCISCAYD